MSVVLQKNCEYFLLEICKPLQCKAPEAKISGLKPPDKKHRKLRFSVLFCCKNVERRVGQNAGQLPDPHPDPHAEIRGKSEKGAERKFGNLSDGFCYF